MEEWPHFFLSKGSGIPEVGEDLYVLHQCFNFENPLGCFSTLSYDKMQTYTCCAFFFWSVFISSSLQW